MAQVVVTIKVMPEDPEVDLEVLREKAELEIKTFGGEVGKVEKTPVGFGLSALNLIFVCDEDLGGTDELEAKIAEIEGVQSCEVTDCRRAIG